MSKTATKSFDLDVDVKSAVPLYEQIKTAVQMAIFTGKLQEGDKVISIRDLSTRYNINPITIMKAYNQLETEGFLFSRRGSGYFVKVDPQNLQQGKHELFRKEVSGFLKRISSLGYSAEDLLEELKGYMEVKKDDRH